MAERNGDFFKFFFLFLSVLIWRGMGCGNISLSVTQLTSSF